MDYLKILNEYKLNNIVLENHPIVYADFEEQNTYLIGLIFVMGADGTIKIEEEDFLKILIKTLGLSEDLIAECKEFVKQPNCEFIPNLKDILVKYSAKSYFISDCYLMAYSDHNFHDKERKLLGEFEELLELPKSQIRHVKSLIDFLLIKPTQMPGWYTRWRNKTIEDFNFIYNAIMKSENKRRNIGISTFVIISLILLIASKLLFFIFIFLPVLIVFVSQYLKKLEPERINANNDARGK